MSNSTDRERVEQLTQLYVRHKEYLNFLFESGQFEAVANIRVASAALREVVAGYVDMLNPRDVEHFLIGAAWMSSVIVAGPLEAAHNLIGVQAYQTLIGAATFEQSKLVEAMAESLPHVNGGRSH